MSSYVAELPAILDSFSLIPQVLIIIGVVGSHGTGGLKTHEVVRLSSGFR